LGIYEELRHKKSKVRISCLCPGPVDTNFNEVAGTSFQLKGLSSQYVAKYAVDKMLKNKLIIIPGILTKIGVFLTRFVSYKFLLKVMYFVQKQKGDKNV
jgi:short-subunit dehydrogenase